jgi:hypothetical protein
MVSEEIAEEVRDAMIEYHSDLDYSDTIVSIFGPFSHKYHIMDVGHIEESVKDLTNPSEVIDEYSSLANAIQHREVLNRIKDQLQEYEINAYTALDAPPFDKSRKSDETINKWTDTTLSESLLFQDMNYIQQSRLLAKASDHTIFLFKYQGNPVGTTFEVADILREMGESEKRCSLFFELNTTKENRLIQKYNNIEVWDDTTAETENAHLERPQYLSAMMEHIVPQYDIKWRSYTEVSSITKRIAEQHI